MPVTVQKPIFQISPINLQDQGSGTDADPVSLLRYLNLRPLFLFFLDRIRFFFFLSIQIKGNRKGLLIYDSCFHSQAAVGRHFTYRTIPFYVPN